MIGICFVIAGLCVAVSCGVLAICDKLDNIAAAIRARGEK
jgi:hypothetical protein